MNSVVLPKRGRGRPSKADIEMRNKILIEAQGGDKTDEEILGEIKNAFNVYDMMVDGCVTGGVRFLLLSGRPGVGKSHKLETKLWDAKVFNGTKYKIISGGISAVHLYREAYKLRHAGNVLVLDDADPVLENEESLAVLKALTDTSHVRNVHWSKESNALRGSDEEEEVPTSYEFHGSIVFVTNYNIQFIVDEGTHKFSPHYEALMSRGLYIDLRIHSLRYVATWVNYVANNYGIFDEEGMTQEQRATIMKYINENRNNLRDLSIRTVRKACNIMRLEPIIRGETTFEYVANQTLARS